MPKVRVPRKGVTQAELASVLSRRLTGGYTVKPDGNGKVVIRRGNLSGARVAIRMVPGATVFIVRGGLPLLGSATRRQVTEALRRSPEFRSL
jgi:hypothetical protein